MLVKSLMPVILAMVLSLASSENAQCALDPLAKFRGVVVDAHIARIPRASVLIEGAGKKWKLETDEDRETVGEINVELPAGNYTFIVAAPGCKTLVVKDFFVTANATISYEFRMEVRGCDDCDGLIAPESPKSVPPGFTKFECTVVTIISTPPVPK